jgi:hypothetical protein
MKKNVLIIASMFFIIGLMMTVRITASDTWDRPIIQSNFTAIVINFTTQLDGLQDQLNNETQARIQNDSYLQNQINVYVNNISQLFQFYYNLDSKVDALNISLTSKINAIDSRVDSLNTSLTQQLSAINSTIKQPTGKYLTIFGDTFFVNETALNETIINISKIRKNLYTTTINVTSGVGSVITPHIEVKITKLTVAGTGTFKFEATEYPTNTIIIDRDRQAHHDSWIIEKNYAINNQVNATITGQDGTYDFTIDYINNADI